MKRSYKDKLYQQHIQERAGTDAEKRIFLPQVQYYDYSDTDHLREGMRRLYEGDILQAVYNQHTDDGKGQNIGQVLYVFRYPLIFRKNQKGQEACQDGSKGNQAKEYE